MNERMGKVDEKMGKMNAKVVHGMVRGWGRFRY